MELRGYIDEPNLLEFPAESAPPSDPDQWAKVREGMHRARGGIQLFQEAVTEANEKLTPFADSLRSLRSVSETRTTAPPAGGVPISRAKKSRAKLKKQKRKNGGPR